MLALAAAALLLSGCSQRQDMRAMWTMPGASTPGQAAERAAPGYAWVYASGQSSGGPDHSAEQPGELPEVGRLPRDELWRADEAQVLALARQTGRPILIDGYADWCEPCMRMAAETFTDPQLRLLLKERFMTLQIDLTEESARAREQLSRYGVDQLPTLLLIAPDGQELDRIDRFISAAELIDRLRALAEQHQPDAGPQAHAEPEPEPKAESEPEPEPGPKAESPTSP